MPTDVADHQREVWSDRDPDQASGFQATPQTPLEPRVRANLRPASRLA